MRGASTGLVIIRGDDKPSQARWRAPRRKMSGGQRCEHWNARKHALEREDGFDSFADDGEVVDDAETHAIAENGAERTPRRRNTRFVLARRVEKRPVNSGDLAAVIGDGGDERRQSLGRRVGRVTIEQRRVIAQRRVMEISGDFSRAQIGLGRRARDRARRCPNSFGRAQPCRARSIVSLVAANFFRAARARSAAPRRAYRERM